MILGRVNQRLEALVDLRLYGESGATSQISGMQFLAGYSVRIEAVEDGLVQLIKIEED
jgi:hypothetical protein